MSTTTQLMSSRAFTERREPTNLWDEEDDSDYEFGDDQVRRIIIVTQSTSLAVGSKDRIKHEGYDRTAEGETRVKMSQEISKVIDDGLFYYEQDLWENNNRMRAMSNSSSSLTKVGLISQEAFDRLTNKPVVNDKKQVYVPPPP